MSLPAIFFLLLKEMSSLIPLHSSYFSKNIFFFQTWFSFHLIVLLVFLTKKYRRQPFPFLNWHLRKSPNFETWLDLCLRVLMYSSRFVVKGRVDLGNFLWNWVITPFKFRISFCFWQRRWRALPLSLYMSLLRSLFSF